MSNQTPARIAWIGAGRMTREHLRAFIGLPGVVPTAIHSRTPSKAGALAQEFALTEPVHSIAELYERTRADLVIVAVPEMAVREVAKQCFAFPWAVLLEKPPGYCLEDATAILKCAQHNGRRVWVALNRRFLSSTQTALADLNTRKETRFVHVIDQQNQQTAAALGHPSEIVANWMFANSIHVVDLLCCFGRGKVATVQPVTRWNPRQPGIVLAHVVFESGDTGFYEGIWNGPGPWAASITTESRRWELRPLEQAAFQNKNERQIHSVAASEMDQRFKPGFRRQAEEVLAALRGEPSLAVPLEEAVATMRLIAAIFAP